MNPREKFMEMIAKKKAGAGGKPVAKDVKPATPPKKKGGFPPKKAC